MSIRDRVTKEREKRCEELGQVINDICDLLEFYGADEKEVEEIFDSIKDAFGIFTEEIEVGEESEDDDDLEDED